MNKKNIILSAWRQTLDKVMLAKKSKTQVPGREGTQAARNWNQNTGQITHPSAIYVLK